MRPLLLNGISPENDGQYIGNFGANGPQAKGRIERAFGTLQDRMVKELRLAGHAGDSNDV